jgi:putative transposase
LRRGRNGRIKKSRYTEEQIAFALCQAQTGTRAEEICRKFGISQATFYNWKKKYGGLGVSELRRLKQVEAESSRLKKMVADLGLDKEMLQDVIQNEQRVLEHGLSWPIVCSTDIASRR